MKLGLVFLFILGLLYPLGHFTGMSTLNHVGLLTASSPFPFVFTSFGDQYDYWAAHVNIEMEDTDGKIHHLPAYPGSMENFGTHHLTQVFHVLPITLSYLTPYAQSAWQTRPMFCRPESVFMRHLEMHRIQIKSYKFVIDPASHEQERKTLEFECP